MTGSTTQSWQRPTCWQRSTSTDQARHPKELDHVDALGRAFIAASPFAVLATAGARGLDCSPKGDTPGFVQVSDNGKTLMIPDRPGNNRIDGLKNLVEDPRVALIFFVPGVNETYRVNGRASISVDPALRRRFAVGGKEREPSPSSRSSKPFNIARKR